MDGESINPDILCQIFEKVNQADIKASQKLELIITHNPLELIQLCLVILGRQDLPNHLVHPSLLFLGKALSQCLHTKSIKLQNFWHENKSECDNTKEIHFIYLFSNLTSLENAALHNLSLIFSFDPSSFVTHFSRLVVMTQDISCPPNHRILALRTIYTLFSTKTFLQFEYQSFCDSIYSIIPYLITVISCPDYPKPFVQLSLETLSAALLGLKPFEFAQREQQQSLFSGLAFVLSKTVDPDLYTASYECLNSFIISQYQSCDNLPLDDIVRFYTNGITHPNEELAAITIRFLTNFVEYEVGIFEWNQKCERYIITNRMAQIGINGEFIPKARFLANISKKTAAYFCPILIEQMGRIDAHDVDVEDVEDCQDNAIHSAAFICLIQFFKMDLEDCFFCFQKYWAESITVISWVDQHTLCLIATIIGSNPMPTMRYQEFIDFEVMAMNYLIEWAQSTNLRLADTALYAISYIMNHNPKLSNGESIKSLFSVASNFANSDLCICTRAIQVIIATINQFDISKVAGCNEIYQELESFLAQIFSRTDLFSEKSDQLLLHASLLIKGASTRFQPQHHASLLFFVENILSQSLSITHHSVSRLQGYLLETISAIYISMQSYLLEHAQFTVKLIMPIWENNDDDSLMCDSLDVFAQVCIACGDETNSLLDVIFPVIDGAIQSKSPEITLKAFLVLEKLANCVPDVIISKVDLILNAVDVCTTNMQFTYIQLCKLGVHLGYILMGSKAVLFENYELGETVSKFYMDIAARIHDLPKEETEEAFNGIFIGFAALVNVWSENVDFLRTVIKTTNNLIRLYQKKVVDIDANESLKAYCLYHDNLLKVMEEHAGNQDYHRLNILINRLANKSVFLWGMTSLHKGIEARCFRTLSRVHVK